jgi:hypothetical protein
MIRKKNPTAAGIENMPWLLSLNIAKTSVTDFSALNDNVALPHFHSLSIDPEMLPYLDTLDRGEVEVSW